MDALTYMCKADTRPLASRVVDSLEDPYSRMNKCREDQSSSEESLFT